MTFLSIASRSVRYSLMETGSLCDLSLRKKSISTPAILRGGGFSQRLEHLQHLGRGRDVGVLRRHVEEVHRVRGSAAVVHGVVRHHAAEVVGEAVDNAAAHAAARRA